ncbi:MAG: hypothetical protein PHD83_06015 [Caldisericia bacterium]|nr:hypothetical protein [Caldisericia bacterium]
MKNKWILIFIMLLLIPGCRKNTEKVQNKPKMIPIVWYSPEWETRELPEKRIELLRFHHTVECEDCRMVGEMVLYLLQNTFNEEAKQGKIIYKSINSELLENKPLLDHFQVMEEDFVINVVSQEEESITHDPEPLALAKEADKLHIYLKEMLADHLSKLGNS